MSIFSSIRQLLRLGAKPVKPVASQSEPGTPPTAHLNEPTVRPVLPSYVSPSARRSERTLIIGVDYGTNSTKVIWQDLSDESFEVFHWTPNKGVKAMLLPSTISIREGVLYFGVWEEDARRGDIVLRSIKLCLLCRRKSSICRCGNAIAKAGLILMPNRTESVPASSLACLFLAYVFHEVESRLTSHFPSDQLHMIWNVGCPLDHLDSTGRRGEWERMIGAAMQLRGRVLNPAGITLVDEATELIHNLLVPPREVRNYFVQPEGLAAVKAFLESPHAEWSTYAIVDVGAGTTEVSFFFNGRMVNEPGQPYRPSYLADSTEAVGGSKIDLELAQIWDCSPEDARRRKESGQDATPMVLSIREICSQYQRTCSDIIKHRRLTSPHDMRFKLFIIGGGGRLRCLQDTLTRSGLPKHFQQEALLKLKPPRRLKNYMEIERHYDLLANACGLASSLDWEYYPPSEVPAMDELSSSPRQPRPDRDELYPK